MKKNMEHEICVLCKHKDKCGIRTETHGLSPAHEVLACGYFSKIEIEKEN